MLAPICRPMMMKRRIRYVGRISSFDCEKDPLELFNVYNDPEYRQTVAHMTQLLELKMLQIGDDPVHKALSSA